MINTNSPDTVFTKAVNEKQTKLGLKDTAMAATLGIPRSIYRETQKGIRPVSMTYLCAIIATLPDLIPDAIVFARENHVSYLAAKCPQSYDGP